MVPSLCPTPRRSWSRAESSRCWQPWASAWPHPLGVSGAEPGLASQAQAAGRSGASEPQPTWYSEGSPTHHPHRASRTGVKNHFTALGFLTPRKMLESEKEILRATQGTESWALFADFASIPFMLKCQKQPVHRQTRVLTSLCRLTEAVFHQKSFTRPVTSSRSPGRGWGGGLSRCFVIPPSKASQDTGRYPAHNLREFLSFPLSFLLSFFLSILCNLVNFSKSLIVLIYEE